MPPIPELIANVGTNQLLVLILPISPHQNILKIIKSNGIKSASRRCTAIDGFPNHWGWAYLWQVRRKVLTPAISPYDYATCSPPPRPQVQTIHYRAPKPLQGSDSLPHYQPPISALAGRNKESPEMAKRLTLKAVATRVRYIM